MSSAPVIVLAVVLLSQAVPGVAAWRDFRWFRGWARWLGRGIEERAERDAAGAHDAAGGGLALLALLAPPLLATALLQAWLAGSIAGGLFAFLALLYAWGPRDLDRDVSAAVAATDRNTLELALASLLPPGRAGRPPLGEEYVDVVFGAALTRWFGVLLWFLLLGPFGALGYRLTALAAQDPPREGLPDGAGAAAERVHRLLDWPAAQLVSLSLAVVANFDAVIGAWRDWHGGGVRLDRGFLFAAGRAGVRVELAEEPPHEDPAARDPLAADPADARALMGDAMSLVWRVLLAWLVLIAVLALAGWAA